MRLGRKQKAEDAAPPEEPKPSEEPKRAKDKDKGKGKGTPKGKGGRPKACCGCLILSVLLLGGAWWLLRDRIPASVAGFTLPTWLASSAGAATEVESGVATESGAESAESQAETAEEEAAARLDAEEGAESALESEVESIESGAESAPEPAAEAVESERTESAPSPEAADAGREELTESESDLIREMAVTPPAPAAPSAGAADADRAAREREKRQKAQRVGSILAAMKPEIAAETLMQLPETQQVAVLRTMEEGAIAKILSEVEDPAARSRLALDLMQ